MEMLDTSEVTSRDPMVDFLGGNRHGINDNVGSLQQSVDSIHSRCEEVFEEMGDKGGGISIRFVGRRLFNDKYVLWFHGRNNVEKLIENFNFSLEWDSSEVLSFVFTMHCHIGDKTELNNPFYYLDLMEDDALLAIVLDRPAFNNELSIEIKGFVSYVDEHEIHYMDELPPVVLKSEDIDDSAISLSGIQQDRNLLNFYSRLVCMWKVDLIIEMAEKQNITEAFIAGGLIPLGETENLPQRFYTISGRYSIIEGTIIEVGEWRNRIFEINVFTKDEKSLLAMVHYLYQKVKPVIVLPGEYRHRAPYSSIHEPTKILKDNMMKEFDCLRSFNDEAMEPEEYKKLRSQLVDLEYQTDLAYLSVLSTEDKNQNRNELLLTASL